MLRDQIAGYLRDTAQTLDKGEEWHLADGVLALLPTQERLAIFLHSFDSYAIAVGESWSECNEPRKRIYLYQASALLAYLTGVTE
jgi:hypothetical protein